jgi:hypothetical protein
MVRTALTAIGMLSLIASAQAGLAQPTGGRLVAGHDANVLSTYTARDQEARFAVNIARFITQQHTGGNLLLIEPSITSTLHDYSPIVEQSLSSAGFNITVTQNTNWTAEELASFDGIFVGTIFDQPYRSVEKGALDTFLTSGGGVYLFSGMGPDREGEANALNTFLTPYGLLFDSSQGPGNGGYNGIYNTSITSDHELFDGISAAQTARTFASTKATSTPALSKLACKAKASTASSPISSPRPVSSLSAASAAFSSCVASVRNHNRTTSRPNYSRSPLSVLRSPPRQSPFPRTARHDPPSYQSWRAVFLLWLVLHAVASRVIAPHTPLSTSRDQPPRAPPHRSKHAHT